MEKARNRLPGSPRADETEEAITKRLETYNEKTAPLIQYYQKEGSLKRHFLHEQRRDI